MVLLGTIGLPGSGKSTFLSRFAAEQHYFYWQNDEARRRLFSAPKHTSAEHAILGGAAFYALEQALQAGISGAYDVNLNQQRHRQQLKELAHKYDAQFHLLWFKVPVETAQNRVQERTQRATGELRAYYEGFGPDFIEQMSRRVQWPTDEPVIILDGTHSYESQREGALACLT